DKTADVLIQPGDPHVARVGPGGRIVPAGNGTTDITIRLGDRTATVPCTVSNVGGERHLNFANDIVPVFTKLGCNGGGCHGKSGGQNGFALSLLGFEPDVDYQTLVKENRGRRLFPASPDNSLLLLKAVGIMAHAGGKRMDVGSDEYKLVRRW